MHKLKNLSQSALISETKSAILEERRATTRILHCFREIESRMLYAESGFSSLHEMAIKYFGLSEGAAHRRISAMRLLKEVPDLAPALEEGRISLSVASTVQDFFRAEKREGKKTYDREAKLELLKKMEGKSKRHCEQELRTISPLLKPREKEKALSADAIEVRFTMTPELAEKLGRLKGILAHQMKGDSSYAKLFEVMAGIALKKADPETKKERKTTAKQPSPTSPTQTSPARSQSRYVPAQIKSEVWRRGQGQCEYVDPICGKRCDSRHSLEYDHIVPFAKGGPTESDNLRLACRTHNTYAAVREFGREKMERYVRGLK